MHIEEIRLMKKNINNYMATKLVTFSADDDIIHAMRVLLEQHLSGAPVLDDSGNMVGILSQKDCLSIVYHTAYHLDLGGKVDEYMTRDVEHIEADSSILEVAEKFLNSKFRRFPVLRGDRLVGQISRHDVMRALDEQFLQNL
jgi:predicted transcriptional regulator